MGGISKNQVRQAIKKIFQIRSWKLFLVLIPMGFLAATLLRVDHIEMVDLREKVVEADKNGNEEEITTAINELKKYTFSHIVVNMVEENGTTKVFFGTGVFYLENQYKRKANEALAKAEESMGNADNNPNGNVFQKAAAVCDVLGKQQGWNYNQAYFDCIMSELNKYPAMDEIEDYKRAMVPPTGIYRQSYASPIWTFGWSGIVILLCMIMVIAIAIRGIIWIILHIALLFMRN